MTNTQRNVYTIQRYVRSEHDGYICAMTRENGQMLIIFIIYITTNQKTIAIQSCIYYIAK